MWLGLKMGGRDYDSGTPERGIWEPPLGCGHGYGFASKPRVKSSMPPSLQLLPHVTTVIPLQGIRALQFSSSDPLGSRLPSPPAAVGLLLKLASEQILRFSWSKASWLLITSGPSPECSCQPQCLPRTGPGHSSSQLEHCSLSPFSYPLLPALPVFQTSSCLPFQETPHIL